MKFTRVVVACNVCWMQSSSQTEREATTTLLFRRTDEPGAQEFRLDLCANHAEKITDLLEYGEKVESVLPVPTAKRKAGRPRKAVVTMAEAVVESPELVQRHQADQELICAVCGRPCRSQSGLSIHTKSKHPAEWEAMTAQRAQEAEGQA